MANKEMLIEEIARLKQEKDAVILAHYYVNEDVQDVADFVGDSFALSKKAADLECKVLVFAGVRFMGESAKLLSPEKTVLMPAPEADCPMAHMVTAEAIAEARASHDDLAVVCYVNSTIETKALSDVCVTSSNALKIVSALHERNIFFVPDRHLGGYIAAQLPDKHFILNPGHCPIHDAITAAEISRLKVEHPGARVLMHPECPAETVAETDFAGSTSGIIEQAVNGEAEEYIIVTVSGVQHEIDKRTAGSGKRFIYPSPTPRCKDMDMITLEGVRDALRDGAGEVPMPDESVREAAKRSLERMLELATL